MIFLNVGVIIDVIDASVQSASCDEKLRFKLAQASKAAWFRMQGTPFNG